MNRIQNLGFTSGSLFWLTDSGCTSHMTFARVMFDRYINLRTFCGLPANKALKFWFLWSIAGWMDWEGQGSSLRSLMTFWTGLLCILWEGRLNPMTASLATSILLKITQVAIIRHCVQITEESTYRTYWRNCWHRWVLIIKWQYPTNHIRMGRLNGWTTHS